MGFYLPIYHCEVLICDFYFNKIFKNSISNTTSAKPSGQIERKRAFQINPYCSFLDFMRMDRFSFSFPRGLEYRKAIKSADSLGISSAKVVALGITFLHLEWVLWQKYSNKN